MKTHAYQQMVVVYSNSADDFQNKFNETMKTLASQDPKVQFNLGMGHCAYITYTDTHYEAETVEDEFDLNGISYKCRNCPEYEWTLTKSGEVNRITKHGKCRISTYGTTQRNCPACEYLYKGILSGTLKPIPDEELEDYQTR